ncbi:hypothetical protein GA707_09480 [Nostocoides sp. F2B08]|uniref:hypothetical protein n=1 Tax=Nostocoides sp. F2B08 TaxID=2653936 RepID=UPI0012635984|nr:hypothetical protein [Tetrasphaera sp. F2B08]KAB7744794.1 hypothetical protein GA707_09480 [Tetrasphaera sp. F2B08]
MTTQPRVTRPQTTQPRTTQPHPTHPDAKRAETPGEVDELLDRMAPTLASSVDTLHVAAVLESSGITDDLARDRYGHPDVFALARTLRAPYSEHDAGAVHPGLLPAPAPTRRSDGVADEDDAGGASSVGHGVIYLLPALCMPALLDLVGVTHAALSLVVGAAVGWLWAVLATWRAYGVMSDAGRTAAEDHLRRSVLVGAGAGAVAGATLALAGAPPVVGVVTASVTLAQLGTTLLFFLRRRAELLLVLVVQGTLGLANLVDPLAVPSTWVLGAFTVAALVLFLAGGALRRHHVTAPLLLAPGLGPVLWYGMASVAFLLIPQAGLLRAGDGSPLALAGLFLTMGLVEWRGGSLSARLRRELATLHSPAEFRRRRALLTHREAFACAAVAALAGAGVLLLLHDADLLTTTGVLVAAATVPLAAAYLVCLVLANSGAQVWLAAAFTGGVVVESTAWGAMRASPALAFVIAAGLLFVAVTVGLLRRPVDRFR